MSFSKLSIEITLFIDRQFQHMFCMALAILHYSKIMSVFNLTVAKVPYWIHFFEQANCLLGLTKLLSACFIYYTKKRKTGDYAEGSFIGRS